MEYGADSKALPITAFQRCGRVFLYLDNRTVTVYADTMNTFKEGDRVTHPTYGAGTVVSPYLYPGDGWYTVNFDNGVNVMTAAQLLTPVPKTNDVPFKEGDRVIHKLHGAATVKVVSTGKKLVEIVPDGTDRSWFVHPISLIPAPAEPKFTLTVTDSDGFTGTVGPFPKDQIDAVLTGGFDWSTVESITINRVKG